MNDKWKMTDKWEWNNATKITLISVIIGAFFWYSTYSSNEIFERDFMMTKYLTLLIYICFAFGVVLQPVMMH